MKVLGIDQSYRKCALVLLHDDTIAEVKILKGDPTKDRIDQAMSITSDIASFCNTHRPYCVGIEGLAFGARGNVTRDLAGLQFMIIACLRKEHSYLDRRIEIYDPKTIKKFATGKGNAKKEQLYEVLPISTKQLFEGLGLKKTTGREDATDAYWIAMYMRNLINANL